MSVVYTTLLSTKNGSHKLPRQHVGTHVPTRRERDEVIVLSVVLEK